MFFRTQLTFTDGSLVDMKDTNYVVASLLCSGDTVRICDEAGCESTVMILEYYAECDMFVVANQNGDVTRWVYEIKSMIIVLKKRNFL